MSADEALVYDCVTELQSTRSLSDHTYARAVRSFGERGLIDIVGEHKPSHPFHKGAENREQDGNQ